MTPPTRRRLLVISGLPCPAAPWRELLADHDVRVVPLAKLLADAPRGDFRDLAHAAELHIDDSTEHIVLHDLGVTIGLITLLRMQRAKRPYRGLLTLFNGAFSGFDILQARHPLTMQAVGWQSFVKLLSTEAVAVDPGLEPQLGKVKQLYRQIILASLKEKLETTFSAGRREHYTRRLPLDRPVQVLEGRNDRFIPKTSIDRLAVVTGAERQIACYDGHFPHADRASWSAIRSHLREFEERHGL